MRIDEDLWLELISKPHSVDDKGIRCRHLTDEHWEKIKVHLPPYEPGPKGGRQRVDDSRCFDVILWLEGGVLEQAAWAVWQFEYLLAKAQGVGRGVGVFGYVAGLFGQAKWPAEAQMSALPTAALLLPERGAKSWQEGQGDEVELLMARVWLEAWASQAEVTILESLTQ